MKPFISDDLIVMIHQSALTDCSSFFLFLLPIMIHTLNDQLLLFVLFFKYIFYKH